MKNNIYLRHYILDILVNNYHPTLTKELLTLLVDPNKKVQIQKIKDKSYAVMYYSPLVMIGPTIIFVTSSKLRAVWFCFMCGINYSYEESKSCV